MSIFSSYCVPSYSTVPFLLCFLLPHPLPLPHVFSVTSPSLLSSFSDIPSFYDGRSLSIVLLIPKSHSIFVPHSHVPSFFNVYPLLQGPLCLSHLLCPPHHAMYVMYPFPQHLSLSHLTLSLFLYPSPTISPSYVPIIFCPPPPVPSLLHLCPLIHPPSMSPSSSFSYPPCSCISISTWSSLPITPSPPTMPLPNNPLPFLPSLPFPMPPPKTPFQ